MKYYLLLNEGEINDEMKKELMEYGVRAYANVMGIRLPSKLDIRKTEKGKPFLNDSPIHFSVSHSGLLWVMLIGEEECGVDIQVMTAAAWKNISKRYFTEAEQAYTEKYGIEGFFRVWVHRESYGKLTGEGFFGAMPDFIDSEGFPKIEVEGEGGRKAYIKDVPVDENIFMAFATYGEDDEIDYLV